MSGSGAIDGARPARSWPTLAALVAGLIAGIVVGRGAIPGAAMLVAIANSVGGLWIDALRMTIIPLLVALVITSIGEAEGASGVSARAIAWFAVLLALAGVICGLVIPPFFVAEHGGAAAARAVASLPPIGDATVPPLADWVRALVPANIVAAAIEGRIVPLVLFAILFGAAARRIEPAKRAVLIGFFAGLRETMLRLVGWILWLAPVGVFALIFAAAAGDAGGLWSIGWRYVVAQVAGCAALLVALAVIVALFRRRRLGALLSSAAEPAMLALASRSSIACLPAMIGAAERMGLDRETSDTVLSLAVSLFKITIAVSGFALMAAMAAFDGHLLGPAQIAIIIVFGIVNTLVVAGLPGQVSFMAATLPVAAAVGVPLTVLPLLLAIDGFADMARTLVNVVADLAVAVLVEPENEMELSS